MNRLLEKNKQKTFAIFPQCRSLIPGYLQITSSLLYRYLYSGNGGDIKRNKIEENKEILWNTYFRYLKKNGKVAKPFARKGWEFKS